MEYKIAHYPCDLCNQPNIGYASVPRKHYRLKKHSMLAYLKLPVDRLLVCEKHKRKYNLEKEEPKRHIGMDL